MGYWRDSITLWTHALNVTGNNSIAENYLANALFTRRGFLLDAERVLAALSG